MKILTYNLHKGRGRRRRSILAEAVEAIAHHEPDILLCQEVFHGAADALHQSQFITEVLGHPFVFGPNSFYRRGCHGNATFARLPVERHDNLDITMSRLERRGMLWTTLASDAGTSIDVFNVHFSLTAQQRRAQWARLDEALPAGDSPVLVCGDFNDWTGSLDRAVRRQGRLRNALWDLPLTERATFPAKRPVFGLDRVYLRGMRVAGVRVLRGPPWSELSDHLPVEVELEIR